MAKGFKHGAVGLPLNFKVVGGTTAPGNPKENTIWVNTDADITAYYFCNESIYTGLGESNFLNATNVINGVGDNGINFIGQLQPTWSNTYLYKTRLIAGVKYHFDSTGLGYGRIGAFSAPSSNEGENQIPLVGGGTLNAVLNPDVSSAIFTPAITTDVYFYYCSDTGNTGANPAFSTWFALYLVGNPVWITTGTSSAVEFNALKKNGIQVYPISAKQYVNNALVTKDTKSYFSGAWHDWIRYNVLYDTGDENNDVTGGWVSEAKKLTNTVSANALTLTRNADSLVIKQEKQAGGGIARTTNKVSLKGYSKLVLKGDITGTNTEDMYSMLCVWSEIGSVAEENLVAWASLANINKTDATVSLDVSTLEDSYYVGIHLYHTPVVVAMKTLMTE